MDVMVGVVVAVLGLVVLGLAVPLLYGVARLVGPWQAYPECARLMKMVARPE